MRSTFFADERLRSDLAHHGTSRTALGRLPPEEYFLERPIAWLYQATGLPDVTIARLLRHFGFAQRPLSSRQVTRIRRRARGEYFFPLTGRSRRDG